MNLRFVKGAISKGMLDGSVVHQSTLLKMKKMTADWEMKSMRYLENSIEVMGSPMPFDERENEFFEQN
ncbi:MAG: hypothetical protein HZC28_08265 [Spirochaetes bacterium]|nr:hypothetical protein [Spirochaetota bacterium]